MIETIVGLALMGIILGFALQMANLGEDQTVGRNDADSLSSFTQLAGAYFLDNRTAVEKAIDDGTDADKHCLLSVPTSGTGGTVARSSTKKTCAFDPTHLRAKGVWPAGMSVDLFGGGRYVAIFRRPLGADGQPTGATESLIVVASVDGTLQAASHDARSLERLAASQSAMGGIGGFIPVGEIGDCKADRTAATFQACGNGWKVNLSDFIDAAQLTTFANALPN